MRATRRASFAALRKANPTPAAKLNLRFAFGRAFRFVRFAFNVRAPGRCMHCVGNAAVVRAYVRSWASFLRQASQFDDQRIQHLDLAAYRLGNMRPQHGKDVSVAIRILALEGKLCGHTSRINHSQQA
jgi:hypothetical protein